MGYFQKLPDKCFIVIIIRAQKIGPDAFSSNRHDKMFALRYQINVYTFVTIGNRSRRVIVL